MWGLCRKLKTAVIGNKGQGNYMSIESDGTFQAMGDATCWDDKLGYLMGKNIDTSSGRIDYSYYNGAVKFQANARYPEEPVVVRHQIDHAWVLGSNVVARPHLHWIQQSSNVPNWLCAYKVVRNGHATTIDSDWSNYTLLPWADNIATYTSGTIEQITTFAEITVPTLAVSDFIITVLFRDSANTSGEFSGADPSGVAEYATDLDLHMKRDMLGSRTEYTK